MKVSKALLNHIERVGKTIGASICVAVGVLAIANVDSVWREQRQNGQDIVSAKRTERELLRSRLISVGTASGSPKRKPATALKAEFSPVEKLKASLLQDELGEQNPFATLSTLDPLNHVLDRGVKSYQRQAYRSPEYSEEIGYDLVSYDIELRDGSHSTLLAYLERPLGELENPKRIPIVIVMEAQEGASKQTLYRSGLLVGQSDMTLSRAQALVNHKLNSGVPFFSVAR